MAVGLVSAIGSVLGGVAGIAGAVASFKGIDAQKAMNKDNLALANKQLEMEQQRFDAKEKANLESIQSSKESANKQGDLTASASISGTIPSLTSEQKPLLMERD